MSKRGGPNTQRATREAKRRVALHNELAPEIRRRIERTLTRDGFLSEAEAKEAAFHMTDWIADLSDLNDLFARTRWDYARAKEILLGFLAHAPHHLVAAARIVHDAPVTDVFEIGAVKGTGRAKRAPGARYVRDRSTESESTSGLE